MPILKDSYTESGNDGRFLRNTTTYNGLGQSFTTTSAYDLGTIELLLYRTATAPTGNVWVELWSVSGDLPNVKLATSVKIPCTNLTTDTNGAYVEFGFNTAYSLSNSTKYVIVLEADYTAPATNRIYWKMHYVGTYSGGTEIFQNVDTWQTSTGDHIFRINEGAYKISGSTTDNARIYVIQNDTLTKYEDVTSGSYSVRVGTNDSSVVVASSSQGGLAYNSVTPADE